MKLEKLLVLLVILAIPVLLITAAVKHEKPENYKKAQYLKALEAATESSSVIVKVNGADITRKDFETAKSYRQDNLPDEEILMILIKNQLLKEEAERLNITVPLEDAREEAQNQKSNYETLGTEKDKDELDSVIKALGLTSDQYWNEYAPSKYQELMIIAKTKKVIGKKALENTKFKTGTNLKIKSPEEAQEILNNLENDKYSQGVKTYEDMLLKEASIVLCK